MRQDIIPKNMPASPGVYCFYDKKGRLLYIGKAKSIKNRVRSHFQNVENSYNPSRIKMMAKVSRIKWQETDSEIEALLRESELIKSRRPKYNVFLRDDKNYFFAGFTKEEYPRIFITHQASQKAKGERQKANFIGPFTEGASLKKTLNLLRKVFPYCTCKNSHHGKCLNRHLNRCPGYCCDKTLLPAPKNKKEYQKNIKAVKNILSGKNKTLAGNLEKEMKNLARKDKFEEAAEIRDSLIGLRDILKHGKILRETPRLKNSNYSEVEKKLQKIFQTKKPIKTIEAYDIANIQGKEAAASLVVFASGRPRKSLYKKFRIKTIDNPNDTAMLAETLKRRMRHKDWPRPDLILIDGGKGQLNTAYKIVGKKTILGAIAKREEELYTIKKKVALKKEDPGVLYLMQSLRDEAHRFARRYHHWLRSQSIK